MFVHKVDGLSEETKMDTFRKIFQTVNDDLADHGIDDIPVNYHMTSIYGAFLLESLDLLRSFDIRSVQQSHPEIGEAEAGTRKAARYL